MSDSLCYHPSTVLPLRIQLKLQPIDIVKNAKITNLRCRRRGQDIVKMPK
jgi:hypothetical protein